MENQAGCKKYDPYICLWHFHRKRNRKTIKNRQQKAACKKVDIEGKLLNDLRGLSADQASRSVWLGSHYDMVTNPVIIAYKSITRENSYQAQLVGINK